MVITKLEVKTKRRPAVTVQKAKCTICVRESIWLAVSAASSSEDSSVSSWFVRFRLGVHHQQPSSTPTQAGWWERTGDPPEKPVHGEDSRTPPTTPI